jgi:hypothetical protein
MDTKTPKPRKKRIYQVHKAPGRVEYEAARMVHMQEVIRRVEKNFGGSIK